MKILPNKPRGIQFFIDNSFEMTKGIVKSKVLSLLFQMFVLFSSKWVVKQHLSSSPLSLMLTNSIPTFVCHHQQSSFIQVPAKSVSPHGKSWNTLIPTARQTHKKEEKASKKNVSHNENCYENAASV